MRHVWGGGQGGREDGRRRLGAGTPVSGSPTNACPLVPLTEPSQALAQGDSHLESSCVCCACPAGSVRSGARATRGAERDDEGPHCDCASASKANANERGIGGGAEEGKERHRGNPRHANTHTRAARNAARPYGLFLVAGGLRSSLSVLSPRRCCAGLFAPVRSACPAGVGQAGRPLVWGLLCLGAVHCVCFLFVARVSPHALAAARRSQPASQRQPQPEPEPEPECGCWLAVPRPWVPSEPEPEPPKVLFFVSPSPSRRPFSPSHYQRPGLTTALPPGPPLTQTSFHPLLTSQHLPSCSATWPQDPPAAWPTRPLPPLP